jgi:hypothetical protein
MHELPYVLRIHPYDLQLLQRLAEFLGLEFPDDLSQKLVRDGIARLYSPETLEAALVAERARLLMAIAELKQQEDPK